MSHTILKICLFLIIVGAVNWGLVGLFDLNIVRSLFGDTFIANVIYILIGISGVVCLRLLFMEEEV